MKNYLVKKKQNNLKKEWCFIKLRKIKSLLLKQTYNLNYEKLRDVVTNAHIVDEKIRYIHASSIGRIADEKIKSGEEPIVSAKLVPYYLRLPQAERELNNKNSLKKENIK